MENSTIAISESLRIRVPKLQILCKQELVTRVVTGNSIVPQGKESDLIYLEIVGQVSLLAIKQLVKPYYHQGRTDARQLVNAIKGIAIDELACAWIFGEKELIGLMKIPIRSLNMVKSVDGNPNYSGFLEYLEKKNQMRIRTTSSSSRGFRSCSREPPRVLSKKAYVDMIPYGYDVFEWIERGYNLGLIEREKKDLTEEIPEYRMKSFEDYMCEKKGMIYNAFLGYVWPQHLQLIKDVTAEMSEMTSMDAWHHLIDQGVIDPSEYDDVSQMNGGLWRKDSLQEPQKIYIEVDEEQKLEMERRIQEEKVKQAQLRKQKEIEKLKLQREQEKQKKKTQQSLAAAKAKRKQDGKKKKV